jgi:radical SAM protein with 4Fe4S-binding SPASM domain
MRVNIQVTKARFYKAFELIYGQAYDKELFTKAKNTVHKESLRKHCGTCNERENCKDPCPDVIPFVNQDWRKRDYREVQSNIRN